MSTDRQTTAEHPGLISRSSVIEFRYKNWRGEVSHRTARIIGVAWGTTEWHPQPGWLMDATDMDKHERRLFAMVDMTEVKNVR